MKRVTRLRELLIICTLLVTILIPFPTPKQYFVLYVINLVLLITLRPRTKPFIDTALLSLVALVWYVSHGQLYAAQKIGAVLFLLCTNCVITELRTLWSATSQLSSRH